MKRFLGLDLGTSSLKALLVDEAGRILDEARVPYSTGRPGPGLAEQDPAGWTLACRTAVSALGLPAGLDAVAVAGHTPTLVLVDEHRLPTRTALTWQDSRAHREAAELADLLGAPGDVIGGNLPWSPAYLPAKLLWLARHDPRALARTAWLMQPKDFLGYAATGIAATDIWSSKGLCRIDDGAAAAPVFAAAGIGVDRLPPRREPWSQLAQVDAAGARTTGLPEGTPVAVGWTDALAGMVALGAFGRPAAFVHTGTSDIAGVSGTAPEPGRNVLHIPVSCAPLPVAYGPTQTAGAALEWLAGVLGRPAGDLLDLALRADPGAVPLFLPYLDGERAPHWDPMMRGRFLDLAMATGPAELARAVLRGVALADRHVLEESGSTDGPVHVGGAAALHPAWIRVRQETWGRPLLLHSSADVAALGAAVLGATSLQNHSVTSHLGRAAEQMAGTVRVEHPAEDDPASAARLFRRYRSAVSALIADAREPDAD